MLSGNCTEALSTQANVTISGSSARLIKNGIAPLPFPLPALPKQYWYMKRGERVRVRGHAPFYATLGSTLRLQRPHRRKSQDRTFANESFVGNGAVTGAVIFWRFGRKLFIEPRRRRVQHV